MVQTVRWRRGIVVQVLRFAQDDTDLRAVPLVILSAAKDPDHCRMHTLMTELAGTAAA